MPNTHRRRQRDSTVELSRVGVGGVYWALVDESGQCLSKCSHFYTPPVFKSHVMGDPVGIL